MKHGLSVSPAHVTWKHQRTSSPAGDLLLGIADARRDSANVLIEQDDPELDISYQLTTAHDPDNASSKTTHSSPERALSPQDANSTFDNTIVPTTTPETDSIQQEVGSSLPMTSTREMTTGDEQATPHMAIAMPIRDTRDRLDLIALADSLDTLSFEEFRQWKSGRNMAVDRPSSLFTSFSLHSLDPSMANPDSLGGLFGLGKTYSPADHFMKSSMHPQAQGHGRNMPGYILTPAKSKGRMLVEHVRNGRSEEVHMMLVNEHVDMKDCTRAVEIAAAHGRTGLLDAILRAFNSTTSYIRGDFVWAYRLSLTSSEYRLDYAKAWYQFVKVVVAAVLCLCPRTVRAGTVCEKVSLGQVFSPCDCRSHCCWGDKLLEPSWPYPDVLKHPVPYEGQCEILQSIGLPTFFVRVDEEKKIEAYRLRVGKSDV